MFLFVHSKSLMFSVGGIQNLKIVYSSLFSFFVYPPLILLGFLKVRLYYNFGC